MTKKNLLYKEAVHIQARLRKPLQGHRDRRILRARQTGRQANPPQPQNHRQSARKASLVRTKTESVQTPDRERARLHYLREVFRTMDHGKRSESQIPNNPADEGLPKRDQAIDRVTQTGPVHSLVWTG